MFKKMILALLPLTLMTVSAKADDLTLDLENINDAGIELIEMDLDIDVDALAAEAGDEQEDAIEACFRRFGYRHGGWGGYRHYRGYFNHCYTHYRPMYSYHTIRHCAPVYTQICRPVYRYYWGCR